MKDLLVILAILVLCIELYRLLRGYWIQRILKKKREARQLRKPRVMKPKSERDCPFCVKEKGKTGFIQTRNACGMGVSERSRRSKKKISTQGYFCPNQDCEYYGITDENIHALVGYGNHGKQELIRGSHLPGLPEEILGSQEHYYIPAENPIQFGRDNHVVVGPGRGCLGFRRSVRVCAKSRFAPGCAAVGCRARSCMNVSCSNWI